jgi:hypothetical protein
MKCLRIMTLFSFLLLPAAAKAAPSLHIQCDLGQHFVPLVSVNAENGQKPLALVHTINDGLNPVKHAQLPCDAKPGYLTPENPHLLCTGAWNTGDPAELRLDLDVVTGEVTALVAGLEIPDCKVDRGN